MALPGPGQGTTVGLPQESLSFKTYPINTERQGHSGENGKTPPPDNEPQRKQRERAVGRDVPSSSGACATGTASAWRARARASPAHCKTLCSGSHTWPARTTAKQREWRTLGFAGHKGAAPRVHPIGMGIGTASQALTVLVCSACSQSFSVSSLPAMALGMTCLLANTSKTASCSSSSCSCRGSRNSELLVSPW